MSVRWTHRALVAHCTCGLGIVLLSVPVWSRQAPEQSLLFAEPLEIISKIEQTVDGRSSNLATLRTVYAGSWLLIEDASTGAGTKSDGTQAAAIARRGSRRLVDLANQEMIQTDNSSQTFWRLTFDRYRDLVRRYQLADLGFHNSGSPSQGQPPDVNVVVQAQSLDTALVGRQQDSTGVVIGPRLRQRRPPGQASALQAWSAFLLQDGNELDDVDDGLVASAELLMSNDIVFSEPALRALEAYEIATTSASHSTDLYATRLIAAARREAGGLVVVESKTSTRNRFDQRIDGRVEVLSIRVLPQVAPDLLAVPAGLTEVPPPLEALVLLLEQERRLDTIGSEARP